jgi:poly[(R)-3-hydroxyalkanoate] polymerase subunit PhaC
VSRKTVTLKMPVQDEHGIPLQALACVEEIGAASAPVEPQGQYSPGSERDEWVRYGRADDHGTATSTLSSNCAGGRDVPGLALDTQASFAKDPGKIKPGDPENWETVFANDRVQTTTPERDGEVEKEPLALVAAIDDVGRLRANTRAVKRCRRRAAGANGVPTNPASMAAVGHRQHAMVADGQVSEKAEPPDETDIARIDVEQLSKNFMRLIEQGGKAMAACLKPRPEGRLDGATVGRGVAGAVKTFSDVAEYWLTHPHRAIEAQVKLGKAYVDLLAEATGRLLGEPAKPVAKSDPKDRRFADPEWSSNPFFDVVKQAYLLTSKWATCVVDETQGIDAPTRRKAEFYVRQIADALSPANFVPTNPELLRETLASNGGNLVRGMRMLVGDIEEGRGRLKIRQSDQAMFEVGRNLAITPGKVIYQNELMQLIQYIPTTSRVLTRPILIVPPWINKYYILDLTPEKSFVKWCVDQGLTVFVISWVNPDAKLAGKGFDDYMREGPLEALKVITTVTGEEKVHMFGYCIGGTLLAAMLAHMAARGDARALSGTLCTAQVDFTHAGDVKVFIDEEQIETIERQMSQTGFLDGHKMAMAFSLLRSNDLIWPYVVNNYLKGRAPRPFDLLHWNSDPTRMPVACLSSYLRNCYLENKLAKGEMVLAGETVDLGNVTVPVYCLATREDHIAPAKSVFLGAKLFGGSVKFVVAGSGHIAGVINPPYQRRYSHWINGPVVSNLDTWLAKAQERPGSWWPHWLQWLRDQDPTEVSARAPGGGKLEPLEDAPGRYVKVRE